MAGTAGGRSQLRRVVFFNLLVAAVLLAGLELAVRIRHGDVAGRRLRLSRGVHDRFTAWRNRPRFSNGSVVINAQGLRHTADVSEKKPVQTLRVFLLGGSAAYGDIGG
jgi:hypothetical protein